MISTSIFFLLRSKDRDKVFFICLIFFAGGNPSDFRNYDKRTSLQLHLQRNKATALTEVAAEAMRVFRLLAELLQKRGEMVEDYFPKSDLKGVQIYAKG